MNNSHKNSNTAKNILICLLMSALFQMPVDRRIFASEQMQDESRAMLLVLEDCDSDNKDSTPPHGDTVSLLNSKGDLVKKFRGLRIKDTFDGSGIIAASGDGRFFAVVENVPGKLTLYETATIRQLWTLWMDIRSVVFANDLIYAVNTHNVFVIDDKGTIVKHARLGGLDIAVDTKHDCLWIVGHDVNKYDLNLEVKFKTKLTLAIEKAGAFSVGFDPTGSVWIAERNIDYEYGSQNRLVKRSLHGSILKTIDLNFSPVCLRIDKSDGSVWTTGITKERDFSRVGDEWPETLDELNELVETKIETFTRKYDSEGNLIFEIGEGGYAIEVDLTDGSVWIAGKANMVHYSAKGEKLGSYTCSSDGQKWLAIVPGKEQNI